METDARVKNIIEMHSRIDQYREERDESFLAAYQEGVPVIKIAESIKMSRRGVYDILVRQGVPFTTRSVKGN